MRRPLHHYQKNLDIAYQIGYSSRAANLRAPLMGMARIQSQLGNYREALDHYHEVLEISKGLGDETEVGALSGGLPSFTRYYANFLKRFLIMARL